MFTLACLESRLFPSFVKEEQVYTEKGEEPTIFLAVFVKQSMDDGSGIFWVGLVNLFC